jgi:hypothetical protein
VAARGARAAGSDAGDRVPRSFYPAPGFRREGDHWIIEMRNRERHEFDTHQAAWAWLDRTAPSAGVH